MNFPSIAIDEFYDDPDSVREFALSQDFYAAKNGEYPGKRTKPLDLLNRELFDRFANRFFSIYYDFDVHRVDWSIDSYFQLIEEYNDPGLNHGWTHVDYNSVVSGVIYLNKTPTDDSGTVICELKPAEVFDYQQKYKHEFNLGKLTDLDFYKEQLKSNNDKFRDTIIFQNRYNRLISFDGLAFHRVQKYGSHQEPRLTQVFFVTGLKTNNTPYMRLSKHGI